MRWFVQVRKTHKYVLMKRRLRTYLEAVEAGASLETVTSGLNEVFGPVGAALSVSVAPHCRAPLTRTPLSTPQYARHGHAK